PPPPQPPLAPPERHKRFPPRQAKIARQSDSGFRHAGPPREQLLRRRHPLGSLSIASCDIIVLLLATQIKHKSGTPIHDGPLKAEVTFCVQGVITPPCGEPSVVRRKEPSSTAPAFSHLSIILRMTPSVTRWSRNARRWECEIESKYLRMSISSTQ